MIQYQNVYDAFMRCDTDKLAEEFAALYDESKKEAEKRLEAAQKVIHASYERMKFAKASMLPEMMLPA